jgi:hypothetical protein
MFFRRGSWARPRPRPGPPYPLQGWPHGQEDPINRLGRLEHAWQKNNAPKPSPCWKRNPQTAETFGARREGAVRGADVEPAERCRFVEPRRNRAGAGIRNVDESHTLRAGTAAIQTNFSAAEGARTIVEHSQVGGLIRHCFGFRAMGSTCHASSIHPARPWEAPLNHHTFDYEATGAMDFRTLVQAAGRIGMAPQQVVQIVADHVAVLLSAPASFWS